MPKMYYIHHLFENIERNYRYFLLAMGALSQKEIQEAVIRAWPTASIETSVKFDNYSGLTFEPKVTVQQFNNEFCVNNIGCQTTLNFNKLLVTQARMMAVYIYQTIEESKYKNKINRELDNFIFHIRNAAAHDNKFLIRKRQAEIACWRNKSVDISMQGDEVFGSFICPADIILLISDISCELKEIT